MPGHIKTDNVMPSVSDLPNLVSSIRHPRRNRSVSIGPQSAADAYETLFVRQRRRRESMSSLPIAFKRRPLARGSPTATEPAPNTERSRGGESYVQLPPTPAMSNHDLSTTLETSTTCVKSGLLTPSDSTQNISGILRSPSQDRRQNEKEEREMFLTLEKPRVRYDVEVVTKLIVYSGEQRHQTLPQY